ncbi:hypothetical protein BaRGS_00031738 [Batillaria attramentaria]|uniref:Uncharacterized protein n=1 Tax=Batillaria attramentaria TaxID=370345 RepID=A0ABD0JR32_9CAEN
MTLLNNTVGQLPEDSEGTIQKQAPIAMTTLPEDSEGTIQKQAPIAMTTLRKKVIFEVLVTGRGVQPKGVRVNDKVDFCVHTEGEVDIFITGPDNSHQMYDKEKVDTRWICTYTPSLPGKYKINLNCSGGVIAKSSIEVEVLPKRKGVPVKAYGPGLQGGRCEQEAVFTVDVDVSSDLDKLM